MGLILFTLHINDLLKIKIIRCFADDTVIVFESDNSLDQKQLIENDFIKIIEWLSHKTVIVNFSKTFLVPVSSYKNNLPEDQHLAISYCGNQINICRTQNTKISWNIY